MSDYPLSPTSGQYVVERWPWRLGRGCWALRAALWGSTPESSTVYGTTRLSVRLLFGERQVSRSRLADSQASIVFANVETGGEDGGCHWSAGVHRRGVPVQCWTVTLNWGSASVRLGPSRRRPLLAHSGQLLQTCASSRVMW